MNDNILKLLNELRVEKNTLSWLFMEQSKQIDINDYIKNQKDKFPNLPGIYVVATEVNLPFVSFCGTTLREKIAKQGKIRKKIEMLNDDYNLSIYYNLFEPDSLLGEIWAYFDRYSNNYHEQVLIEDFKPFLTSEKVKNINLLNINEEKYYREILLADKKPESFSIFLLKEILVSNSLIEKRFYAREKSFNGYKTDNNFVNESNIIIFEYFKSLGFYDKKKKNNIID